MVIRFRNMPVMADALKRHVKELIARMSGSDGFYEGGTHHTAFSVSQHFYVRPNGDLYVDDDYEELVTGMLLQGLRARSYRIEDAEIIEPHVHHWTEEEEKRFREISDQMNEELRKLDEETAEEDDDIISFEDYLPNSYYDDGHFEEEMEEISHLSLDDDDDE